jgi:AraC-like DNA-binding protein
MTKAPVPQVVGHIADQTERARITGALRGWALVLWVGALSDLPDAVRGAKPAPLAAVVGAHAGAGTEAADVIARLQAACPDVPIVAYCQTGVQAAGDVRRVAEAGAHEYLFAGVDDDGVAVRGVFAAAQRACAARRVSAALEPLLPEPLGRVAQACLTHPVEARTVTGLARLLGINRKTLLNHCARLGGPPPAEFVGWCRLLLAAHLLAVTGETVEWVALELEYPSDTALRNTMKRYTGLRAGDVALRGGMPVVLKAFRRRLRELA